MKKLRLWGAGKLSLAGKKLAGPEPRLAGCSLTHLSAVHLILIDDLLCLGTVQVPGTL